MRFELRHTFDVDRARFERAFFDPELPAFLKSHMTQIVDVVVLDRAEDDRAIRRKVRYVPAPLIKSVGPKPVDPAWLAFVEESTFDKAAHTIAFRNLPAVAQVREHLVNEGTVELRDAGGRTERVVAGELRVKLPFLLKPLAPIAESLIHAEAKKLLDDEARAMTEWLRV